MLKCDRCGKSVTKFKMSFFNMELICKACQYEEAKHPMYRKAKKSKEWSF